MAEEKKAKAEVSKAEQKNELTMSGYFMEELDRISGALPEKFNKQRFALNFVSLVNDKKELKDFSKEQLATAMIRTAQDGLDVLNGEVYIYKGYSGDLTYTPSYRGMKKMAIEKSVKPIAEIYAKEIHEGDTLDEEIIHGVAHVNFKSNMMNKNKPVIGAVAVCLFKDGSEIYEIMTIEELEKIKSKSRNSGAWRDFPGEMRKKSAIRRLVKNITVSWDSKEQFDAFMGTDDFIDDPQEQAKSDIENNANSVEFGEQETFTVDENGEIVE